MADLTDPLTVLKGVGPALAKTLENLDLHCVEDLLFPSIEIGVRWVAEAFLDSPKLSFWATPSMVTLL